MTVLDANILIYATNEEAPQHAAASRWLAALFDSSELIGLPWQSLWAFARISTSQRTSARPLPAQVAFQIIKEWQGLPGVAMINPGPRHIDILEALVTGHGVSGPLMSDAVLAALAIENGAILASTDHDFSRFKGLRWVNPLA